MQAPPPEKRRCEECLNTMTLNLFRLNSSKCRYCQDGITIPIRLLENNPQSELYQQQQSSNKDTNQEDIKEPNIAEVDEVQINNSN